MSYWDTFRRAEEALAEDRFVEAERWLGEARARREGSPAQVLFSEKLVDGMQRVGGHLFRHDRRSRPGRWERAVAEFRARFLAAAETTVRDSLRVADLRPEEDAETHQPRLEAALHLVTRSEIFGEEPSSAVVLLKAVLRTARRTGRLPPTELVQAELPLTEEDRLWLARLGDALLRDVGEDSDTGTVATLARALGDLLQPAYFGEASRFHADRAWLEAKLLDRHGGDAARAVGLYRALMAKPATADALAARARVRLFELLANVTGQHFPVPRYGEAGGVLRPGDVVPEGELADRARTALAVAAYRRPTTDPGACWISVAADAEGTLGCVFWSGVEPRDLARWHPRDDAALVSEFATLASGRIFAADAEVAATLAAAGLTPARLPDIDACSEIILEPWLGAAGLDAVARRRLIAAGRGPWRSGWDRRRGHPALSPPDAEEEDRTGDPMVAAALATGFLWLACRERVRSADPVVRAGIGELARRSPGVAGSLYGGLVLGDPTDCALDAAFAPWTLPLLWGRPDPVWSGGGALAEVGRPELASSRATIVIGGDVGATCLAWGPHEHRWRVVLDARRRAVDLGPLAPRASGPVTLLPEKGRVHRLDAAIELLEDLAGGDEEDVLLAVAHWIRLAESHNGDLLDYAMLRPRPAGVLPWLDRYRERIAGLRREPPDLRLGPATTSWAGQYCQRARRSGLVIGTVDELTVDTAALDALWGVHEGADAAWLFHDAAAVLWHLHLERGDTGTLIQHLAVRGGRHLSLLRGVPVLARERDELLASWLAPFGSPDRFVLDNRQATAREPARQQPSDLELAAAGWSPDSLTDPVASLAARLVPIDEILRAEPTRRIAVAPPPVGPEREPWARIAADPPDLWTPGRFRIVPSSRWRPPQGEEWCLFVPALTALSRVMNEAIGSETPAPRGGERIDRNGPATTRALCGLELAALASHPSPVIVADPRWWWLMRPTAAEQARGWSASIALAAAGTAGALPLFDLSDPLGSGPWRARAQRWLGTNSKPREGAEDSLLAEGAAGGRDQRANLQLIREDGRALGRRLAVEIGGFWERGELDRWLLVVSDEPPEDPVGAAGRFFIAALNHLGEATGEDPTVRTHPAPGPIVWARPRDLAAPGVADLLDSWPPTAILGGDLADWLPDAVGARSAGAVALRTILATTGTRRWLHAGPMTAAWNDFLRGVIAEQGGTVGAPRSTEIAAPAASGPGSAIRLDPGPGYDATGGSRRLLALLGSARRLWPRGEDDFHAAGPRLVPVVQLAHLAGLPPDEVLAQLRDVRWLARLRGVLVGVGDETAELGAATLVRCRRYAEIEAATAELTAAVPDLVAALHSAAPGGVTTRWDLVAATAALSTRARMAWDVLLALWSAAPTDSAADGPRSSGTGDGEARAAADSAQEPSRLLYAADLGALFSPARRIRHGGDASALRKDLESRLRQLMRAARDRLLEAAEVDGSLQVRVPGAERDETLLAAGALLDWWAWHGRSIHAAIPFVDLLRLHDAEELRADPQVRELLQCLADERRARITGESIGAAADSADAGSRTGSLGQWLRRRREPAATADAARRVARVADPDTVSERQLVLSGFAGSGRHSALVAGLRAAHAGGLPAAAVTLHCPDTATAARMHGLLRRHWPVGPPRLRLPGEETPPPAAAMRGLERSGIIEVLVEAQRFAAEDRYRIGDSARDGRLIVTVDPHEATEPWENLFLTVPRSEETVHLTRQLRQARRLWDAVRGLTADPVRGRHGSVRRERGDITTRPAGNLDECLSCVLMAREGGRLGTRTLLAAPLAEDLAYLGRSLVARGWRAVYLDELEALLVPGPAEFLACLGDLAATAAESVGGDEASGPEAEPARGASESSLLSAWLTAVDRPAYRAWLDRVAPKLVARPLPEIFARILRSPWAAAAFADSPARQRVTEMLGEVPAETVSDFLDRPLWKAWRGYLLEWRGEELDDDRPLVMLTTSGSARGSFRRDAVYLCAGTEPASEHARVLGRVADRVLILYHERSPLPGAEAAGGL